jgi:hypothetical protein
VEKFCRAGQATDGNMAHALCMLDNVGHTQSEHGILNAFPRKRILEKWVQIE